MKKSNIKKTVHANQIKNDCFWFDSQNARLIVLCATLGIFGAHKFAQRKYFQGMLYILLDLTVLGMVLTLILSWLDLIFLTAKSDNRPGNMILGAIFILFESFILIPQSSSIVIRNINPDSKDLINDTINPKTEEIVADNANSEVVETISIDGKEPLFVSENGKLVPVKVTVDSDDAILLVADGSESVAAAPQDNVVAEEQTTLNAPKPAESVEEQKQNVDLNPAPVAEKPVEPAKVQKVNQPKKQQAPKQVKKEEVSANNQKEEAVDDFGSFSLYGMIAGE